MREVDENGRRIRAVVEGVRPSGSAFDVAGQVAAVLEHEQVGSASPDDVVDAARRAQGVRAVRHRYGAVVVDGEGEVRRHRREVEGIVIDVTRGGDRVVAPAVGENESVVRAAADDLLEVAGVAQAVGPLRDRDGVVAVERDGQGFRDSRQVESVAVCLGSVDDGIRAPTVQQDKGIVAVGACKRVVRCGSDDPFDMACARRSREHQGIAEIERDAGTPRRVVERVDPAARLFGDRVGPAAREGIGIVIGPAGERIVARAAGDNVVPGVPYDGIGLAVARQGVIACATRDVAEMADAGRPGGGAGDKIDRHGRGIERVIEGVCPARAAVEEAGKICADLEHEKIVSGPADNPLDHIGLLDVVGTVGDRNRAVRMQGHGQVGRHIGEVEDIDALGAVIDDGVRAPVRGELVQIGTLAAIQLVVLGVADQEVVPGAAGGIHDIAEGRRDDGRDDDAARERGAYTGAFDAEVRCGGGAVQARDLHIGAATRRVAQIDAVPGGIDDGCEIAVGRFDGREDVAHGDGVADVDGDGRSVAERDLKVVDERPPVEKVVRAASGKAEIGCSGGAVQICDRQRAAAAGRIAQVDAVGVRIQPGIEPRVRIIDRL